MSEADETTRPLSDESLLLRGWNRLRHWSGWLLAGYWSALFVGTHIPIAHLKEMPKFSDKLMHFGAYAGLAFLLGTWLSVRQGYSRGVAVKVLLIVAIYGIADELLQIPVNRSAEVADWAADVLGCLGGLAVLFMLHRRVTTGRAS